VEAAVVVAGSGAAVVDGSGVEVVVAGTGSTVAVVMGAGSDVGVLAAVVVGSGATEVAVWMKAPPRIEAGVEASGAALVVGAGAASEVVVAAGVAALDPDDPDDPEDPEEKNSDVVRAPTVPDWQELGPELQPISRLATSEA